MRSLAYGGGPMPRAVVERALELLPDIDLVNAYGLTETSSTIAVLGPRRSSDCFASDDPVVRARLGSVGQVLPGVELSIRDANGDEVGPNEAGEIWVRGDQVSGEYVGSSPPRRRMVQHARRRLRRRRGLPVPVRPCRRRDRARRREPLAGRDRAGAGRASVGRSGRCGRDPRRGVGRASGRRRRPLARERARPRTSCASTCASQLRSARTPERIAVYDELPFSETGKLLRRVLRDELSDTLRAVGGGLRPPSQT